MNQANLIKALNEYFDKEMKKMDEGIEKIQTETARLIRIVADLPDGKTKEWGVDGVYTARKHTELKKQAMRIKLAHPDWDVYIEDYKSTRFVLDGEEEQK